MISFLTEPLQYAFMVRGLLAAIFVGIVCAVVGTYVVLRGMAFFGDALSHAILPGIAVGYLVGGGARESLFWWALITAILTSIGIGAISRSTKIKEDTAIGISSVHAPRIYGSRSFSGALSLLPSSHFIKSFLSYHLTPSWQAL